MHRSFNDSCFEHEKGYLLKRVLEHQVKLETMVGEIQTCLKMVDVYLAFGNVCVDHSGFLSLQVILLILRYVSISFSFLISFFLEFVAIYFYYCGF